MFPRTIEGVHGKTIAKLEIIDLNGMVEIELSFTDKTCLHLRARSRSEVGIRQFGEDGEVLAEHEPAAQESFDRC